MPQASSSGPLAGDGPPPAQQPATTQSLEPEAAAHEISGEADEEWEYEYSTTETETYYLTIELSYPEFKGQVSKNPHHSRGGYYKHWLGRKQMYPELAAGPEHGGDAHGRVAATGNNSNDNNNNDDDDVPDQHVGLRREAAQEAVNPQANPQHMMTSANTAADDDDLQIDPALFAPRNDLTLEERDTQPADGARGGTTLEPPLANSEAGDLELDGDDADQLMADGGSLEDIQILDLHSDRPVISYRGRVFEGQWAEVIGTEAIFARRDPGARRPLPALRSLPDNVDLLAASASRILTTEKAMVPRKPAEDSLAAIRREWNIKIPRGRYRSGEKMKQVNFLERLIALKMKKGETDRVTVYAKDGAGKDFRDDRDPEFRPRRKRPSRRKAGSDESGGEEAGEEAGARRRKKRPGRPRGRTRTRTGSGHHRGLLHGDMDVAALSQPTPTRWVDMEVVGDVAGRGEDEDEDEDEDGDGDGDVDADSSDYDGSEGSRKSDGSNPSDVNEEDSDDAGEADPTMGYEDISMAD